MVPFSLPHGVQASAQKNRAVYYDAITMASVHFSSEDVRARYSALRSD